MSLLSKIVDFVEAQLSLNKAETLWMNGYPDNPDTLVAIFDAGGSRPETYSSRREKHFEIKVRSNTYDEGNSLCEQVMNLFHSKENFYIDDIYVLHSYALTEITYLYADSKERDEFSFELAFYLK